MDQRPAAPADQFDKAFRQHIGRVIINHRAHIGLRVGKGFIHDQLVNQSLQFGDNLVIHAVDHHQATGRRAALPCRDEC